MAVYIGYWKASFIGMRTGLDAGKGLYAIKFRYGRNIEYIYFGGLVNKIDLG